MLHKQELPIFDTEQKLEEFQKAMNYFNTTHTFVGARSRKFRYRGNMYTYLLRHRYIWQWTDVNYEWSAFVNVHIERVYRDMDVMFV